VCVRCHVVGNNTCSNCTCIEQSLLRPLFLKAGISLSFLGRLRSKTLPLLVTIHYMAKSDVYDDGPQVCYDSSAPELYRDLHAPEVYHINPKEIYFGESSNSDTKQGRGSQEPILRNQDSDEKRGRICGLRRRSFAGLVLLGILIVGVSIGVSIGGTIAVQSRTYVGVGMIGSDSSSKITMLTLK
jgi:hypothetical protein